MNEVDRRRLDIAVEMGAKSVEIAQQLSQGMLDFEERLASLSEIVMQGYATTATMEFVVAEIFAELSKGDRDEFDRILARATALFESTVAASDDGQVLQSSMDGLIGKAELAFSIREGLG
jgi:PIN domain nuclease of toxin-antitoxin system